MDDDEFRDKWRNVCKRIDGIHSDEDLHTFMSKELAIPLPLLDDILFRVYLVPDFSKKTSAVILKANHCIGDGISFTRLLLTWSDKA